MLAGDTIIVSETARTGTAKAAIRPTRISVSSRSAAVAAVAAVAAAVVADRRPRERPNTTTAAAAAAHAVNGRRTDLRGSVIEQVAGSAPVAPPVPATRPGRTAAAAANRHASQQPTVSTIRTRQSRPT
jgi:hypothetical protein